MDNSELKSIAIGALTGHWPAHLGLVTDGERIEWLARQVESLTDNARDFDEENDTLSRAVETLEDNLRGRIEVVEDILVCTDCTVCAEHRKEA